MQAATVAGGRAANSAAMRVACPSPAFGPAHCPPCVNQIQRNRSYKPQAQTRDVIAAAASTPALAAPTRRRPRCTIPAAPAAWLQPPCHRSRSTVSAAAAPSGAGPSPTSSIDFAAPPVSPIPGRRSRSAPGAASIDYGALSFDEIDALAALPPSQQPTDAAPQRRRTTHGGQDASLASMQEQERELVAVSSDLPKSEARLESLAGWVGAAAAFGAGVWAMRGTEAAEQYFAGYLLEQSLSVDNLFVFILVFKYFKTPPEHQPRVLTWGIATAAVLRGVMVLLGTELIERFEPVLLGFALLLLWSAWGILAGGDDEEEDLSHNQVVKFCRRLLPVSDHYDGAKFFTDVPLVPTKGQQQQLVKGAGAAVRRMATPLLLTLAVVEISDVVFAVDSIPAVFGVTRDPFIVYTSNIFAILSLRSLYSFVSTIMSELRFLDKAVAMVLAFVGGKMVVEYFGTEVPTGGSLLTVAALLGGSVAASLMFPEPKGEGEEVKAAAEEQ